MCEEHERRKKRRKAEEILARWREEWEGCEPRIILNFLKLRGPGSRQLRKSGADERGETAKSAYCVSWSSLRDKQSPTVNGRKKIGDSEPKRLLCL